MAVNGRKLGDLLLEADVLTRRQLKEALAMQASGDKRQIGEILIELKYITLDDLTEIMLINGHESPSQQPAVQPIAAKPIDYKWHILGYDIPWWGGKRIYILPAVGLSILTYGIIWG